MSLPWPCPVQASEPNSSTVIRAGDIVATASSSRNIPAAIIGPTVCELDGPMPILNRSKALIIECSISVLPWPVGSTRNSCK